MKKTGNRFLFFGYNSSATELKCKENQIYFHDPWQLLNMGAGNIKSYLTSKCRFGDNPLWITPSFVYIFQCEDF